MYELAQGWFGNWRVYFTSPTTGDRTWVATFRFRCMAEKYIGRRGVARTTEEGRMAAGQMRGVV